MRGVRRALLASAALCFASSPSLADDPYADYRIPAHNWHSWSADVRATGSHQFAQIPGTQTSTGDLRASGNSAFASGFDSDPGAFTLELAVDLNGRWLRATNQQEQGTFRVDARDHFESAAQTLSGFVAWSRYPWKLPLGLALSSNPAVSWGQSWDSFSSTATSPPFESQFASNTVSGSYVVVVPASASVNWGRVRDATPVYQVQVLEQRLQQLGTIRQALSRRAREQLASLYTMEQRAAFAHERPTKFFWGELERILREDGALGESGLDAYAVQKLLEPITIAGARVARTAGASIGPIVTAFTSQSRRVRDLEFSTATLLGDSLVSSSESRFPRSTQYLRNDRIFTGLAADYHRPLGPSWQLDAASRAQLNEGGRNLFVNAAISAIWLVADRWLASSQISYGLDATGPALERHVDSWNLAYGAHVDYFFEDSWALEAAANFHQDAAASGYRRDEFFSLGVTYQLSGLLNAPGLFAPMRLTPPAR